MTFDSPTSAAAAPAMAAPRRASAAFMLSHPAHAIALGFGSGLSPFAPGTVGTLWGWMSFLVLKPWLSAAQMGLLIAGGALVGWWASTTTARNLRVADPGAIVWDEIVAFWLVLWLAMPMGLLGQIVAFALFRFFDAAKPGPLGGLTACSKALAGAVAGAFCLMTLWPRFAPCWCLRCGGSDGTDITIKKWASNAY